MLSLQFCKLSLNIRFENDMHIFRTLSIYSVMFLQFPKGRPLITLFAKTDLRRHSNYTKSLDVQSNNFAKLYWSSDNWLIICNLLVTVFLIRELPTKISFFSHNKSFCNSYSFTTIFADRVSIFGLQQDWQKLIMFILGPPRRKAVSIFMGGFICYYSNLYFTSWPQKSSDNQQWFTKPKNP